MSILYCVVPHFAAALARRDNPALGDRPLVLIGPEGRVFAASADAAGRGVSAGLPARTAEVRCPDARLIDADMARCRGEFEAVVQILERAGSRVEPHGWGAAYVDLDDLARGYDDGVVLCRDIGRAVRHELGQDLQPALGWNSTKFTAHAAARQARPGHLLAVPPPRERAFLRPLPAALLPLALDALQRLHYLGLRTLGQYAALSPAAVWQQFGRPGRLAHRCARGEDDRPVVPRDQAPHYAAGCEFEAPVDNRDWLLAALRRQVAPLLARLRDRWQACGQLRLIVHFDGGGLQEKTHVFLFPVAEEERMMRALGQMLDGLRWTAPATTLEVALEQVQEAAAEQLALFPEVDDRAAKLKEVERYLAARFGASHLRRVALVQPGAPLPEWRAGWMDGSEG